MKGKSKSVEVSRKVISHLGIDPSTYAQEIHGWGFILPGPVSSQIQKRAFTKLIRPIRVAPGKKKKPRERLAGPRSGREWKFFEFKDSPPVEWPIFILIC